MSAGPNPSRRRFLTSTLALGVWTLGGFPAAGEEVKAAAPTPATPPGFGLWLQFAQDGGLTILTNAVEIGQGTHNAVIQIAAEELALPFSSIRIAQAPVSPEFIDRRIENYATFGSIGFRLSLMHLGPVCAAARDMLLRAAAAQWKLAPAECSVAEGAVHHAASNRKIGYRDLLTDAALLTPSTAVKRKPREQWSVLGKTAPRFDIPPKVDGSAVFGIDVERPGMLVATVLHAPTFGGTLKVVDERPARAIRGVHLVVRLPGAIAVVADGYWPALKGARALKPSWMPGPHADMDQEKFRRRLLAAAQQGTGRNYTVEEVPRTDIAAVAKNLADATQVIDLTFDVPFLAHATMEPMNATAEVSADSAELWLSTQSALDTQRGVAKALGLPQSKVTIHPQLAGGGYGRRLEHAFAVEAALIAKAVGKPVKLIWSREVDMRAGGYRPAAAARVRMALGADRMPTAARVDLANPSILDYSGVTLGPPSPADWAATMGWGGQKYAIPALHLNCTKIDEGVPCGYWRSVGASQNVFFLECVIDQAAHAANLDPVEYRRRLFAKETRRLRFVDALAERANWSQTPAPGHFRGMAISQGNSAISGHVVELSIAAPGKFRLHRVVAAIDVGVIANPDTVEAQIMGGTLFGLSAALFGEITMKNGVVEQGNFDSYPVVKMGHVPPMEFVVLGNAETDRPEGAGEEGVASIAPAIANALYAATGLGVTRLPLNRAGWELVGPG